MVKRTPEQIITLAQRGVKAQLSVWATPSPNHIDYEVDEFNQQASIDLWIALRRRPRLEDRSVAAVIRRSMYQLLRKRLGKNGCKAMIRMTTESLDQFTAPTQSNPFILYDTLDYISSKLGNGTGLILECFKRGASITDIIDVLQMSLTAFYARLERIRRALEN